MLLGHHDNPGVQIDVKAVLDGGGIMEAVVLEDGPRGLRGVRGGVKLLLARRWRRGREYRVCESGDRIGRERNLSQRLLCGGNRAV